MSNREQILALLSPRHGSPTHDIADAIGITKALAYDHLKRMRENREVTGEIRTARTAGASRMWWWKRAAA